jgi:hypothetical protein
LIAIGLLVLGIAISVIAYESGWRGAERYSLALMEELRKRPEELGAAVWSGMVLEQIEAKRITHAEVAAADLLNWSKLPEDDRKLIVGAASGAYIALARDTRCRASTGIDKSPKRRPPRRPPSPPSMSTPGTVGP